MNKNNDNTNNNDKRYIKKYLSVLNRILNCLEDIS